MTYPKLMSYSKLTDQATAVAVALGELDVRPDDRVLIMLPDGPGFAESFTGAMQQGAVPLPANPLLPAHDVVSVAAEAGARLVLASVDRILALAELDAEPPALIDGPEGLWAAALRLR
jgi:acyl-CoA synthetase (AMP-forming)/AMP-acid ligase II